MKVFIISSLLLAITASAFAQDDELDALRRVIPGEPGKDYPIFSTNYLCVINPRNPGCPIRGAGGNNGGQRQAPQKQNKQQEDRAARQSARRGSNAEFEAAIARGEIPGVPGKDYPINSVSGLKKKGFGNIRVAPSDLVVPGYPNLPAGSTLSDLGLPPPPRRGNNRKNNKNVPSRRQNQNRPAVAPRTAAPRPARTTRPTRAPRPTTRPTRGPSPAPALPINNTPARPAPPTIPGGEQEANGKYCPGGALAECINFCPAETYGECTEDCALACDE